MVSGSMRFTLSEVLSGMLASIQSESFTDDPERLAAMFEQLATQFTLFAPLAAAVDTHAVSEALQKLEQGAYLEKREGGYALTEAGRAHCIRSKRTLFGKNDIEQLEQAALVFDQL